MEREKERERDTMIINLRIHAYTCFGDIYSVNYILYNIIYICVYHSTVSGVGHWK